MKPIQDGRRLIVGKGEAGNRPPQEQDQERRERPALYLLQMGSPSVAHAAQKPTENGTRDGPADAARAPMRQ